MPLTLPVTVNGKAGVSPGAEGNPVAIHVYGGYPRPIRPAHIGEAALIKS